MVALALAGIAAPVIFTILVVVQGWLQPDYNHVRMPISALAVWPAGWIQNINFYAFGALMMAYAIGLHRGIRPTRRGIIGVAILVLSGIGLVLAGLCPMIKDGAGAIREPAGHVVAAFMAFLGAGIGLMVISRRMAADPAWRHLAGYALASGFKPWRRFRASRSAATNCCSVIATIGTGVSISQTRWCPRAIRLRSRASSATAIRVS